jgi:membrane associated rhomboid family serine protease
MSVTDSQPPFDWIEIAARLSRFIGLSPVQTRWKLMAWRDSLKTTKVRAQNKVEQIQYEHKICPYCQTLQDQGNKRCVNCGRSLLPRWMEMLRRTGLVMPRLESVSTAISLALILIYARMVIFQGGGGIMMFQIDTLVQFGAHYPPLVVQGQWWRLFTAVFLHAGLWHLMFNVIALQQIGPMCEQIFGRTRMLFYFMLTAVVANVGYQFFGGDVVSVGASGGLMGLIGLAGGWGQKEGSGFGLAVRNQMVKWAVYTIGFGFFIGANNIAHLGGFVCGFLIGFLVKTSRQRNDVFKWVDWVEAVLGVTAALGTFFLCMFPPGS